MIVTLFHDPSSVLQEAGSLHCETWIKFCQMYCILHWTHFSKKTLIQPAALFLVLHIELPLIQLGYSRSIWRLSPLRQPPTLDHPLKYDQVWSRSFGGAIPKEESAFHFQPTELSGGTSALRCIQFQKQPWDNKRNTQNTGADMAAAAVLKCGWRLLL